MGDPIWSFVWGLFVCNKVIAAAAAEVVAAELECGPNVRVPAAQQ